MSATVDAVDQTEPITEELAFGPLIIAFDDRVLRPRPWTAAQSHWALELLPDLPPGPVLELCSGAGQIGLLAAHGSGRSAVLVDQSEVACSYARRNAARAGVPADVRCGPMSDQLAADERFPMILADPPWVPSRATGRFPEDPLTAIDGGADGLAIARTCLSVIADHLGPQGSALLQLGTPDQAGLLGQEAPETYGLEVTAERDFGTRGVLIQLVHVDRPSGS